MKKGLTVLSILFLVAAFSGVGNSQQQPIVWKMQSTWTAGDFHQQNPTKFVKIVEQMSGGRLEDQPHGRRRRGSRI